MADILLFRPKFLDHYVKVLPVPWGLLYVGSALVDKGYSVRIIDEFRHPKWQKLVLEEIKQKPLLVGVSSMTGLQIKNGLAFSAFIKKHSDIPVVWGGTHPSIFPLQTLKSELIDFIVKGDGEEAAVELVKRIDKKTGVEKIKGLGYKQNNMPFLNGDRPFPALDDLPRIDFSLIEAGRYIGSRFGSHRSFELCTSRGCPHRCKFCYNVNHYKGLWRTMSLDRIFDDLHEITDKFRVDGLTWREDNFFADKNRVEDIAQRLIDEKITLRWHADCRIDDVCSFGEDFLALLKESGCHTLTLGAESGSNKILEDIDKGITRERIIEAKDKLTRHQIYQNYHFMMGLPDERKDDIKKTTSLMHTLMRKNRYFGQICGPSLYTPYPGTALYEESLAKGFEPPKTLEGWIEMDWYSLHLPWITGSRRKKMEDIAWNVMGMSHKTFGHYFRWKFSLLAKLGLHIPCFEKTVYLAWKKGRELIRNLRRVA